MTLGTSLSRARISRTQALPQTRLIPLASPYTSPRLKNKNLGHREWVTQMVLGRTEMEPSSLSLNHVPTPYKVPGSG